MCPHHLLFVSVFRPKRKAHQQALWVPTSAIIDSPARAFYDRLDGLLAQAGFHDHLRQACRPYYTASGPGRIGIDPVVYFKMLIVGQYEGIESERALAARCADSLAIRHFLRYELTESTPTHSSLTYIRQRLPEIIFEEAFALIVHALSKVKLVRGKRVGIDTSVIEANASLKELRRKTGGQAYADYVRALAAEAGEDPDDAAAVRRFDKNRKDPNGGSKKVSNTEWENPHDPEAKIGPTKRGATRMIYKAEHTVDLETGAIVDVDILPGDHGDTVELGSRVAEIEARMNESLGLPSETATIKAVVADTGYYSTEELVMLQEAGIEAIIPDKSTPRNLDRLSPTERRAVEAARARAECPEGRALQRLRGELVERSFQHTLDAGGARRTTVRSRRNVLKRYLIQSLTTNLSLWMRTVCGIGTMRQALALPKEAVAALEALFCALWALCGPPQPSSRAVRLHKT